MCAEIHIPSAATVATNFVVGATGFVGWKRLSDGSVIVRCGAPPVVIASPPSQA